MWSLVKAAHLAHFPRRRGPGFFQAVLESRWDPQPRVGLREADSASDMLASGGNEFPMAGGVETSGVCVGDSPLPLSKPWPWSSCSGPTWQGKAWWVPGVVRSLQS